MKNIYRYLLYITGFFFVIILGIVFGQYTINMPVIYPFGFAFLALLFIMELITEIWRGKSSHVISNVGHYSICGKLDIHHVPFHDDHLEIKNDQNQSLGDMTVMFLGGIDHIANVRSGPDKPVFIFPSIYEENEENCYHINATLKKWKWKQLSPYIKTVLSRYGRRINPDKTPIYYGITSHINGSATPQNIKIELKDKKKNELITSQETVIDKLFDMIDREDKRKIKNIFYKGKGEYEEE